MMLLVVTYLVKLQVIVIDIDKLTTTGKSAIFAESAYDKFRTDDGKYPTVVITYRSVDNVQRACDAEALKRDGKPFGFGVTACNFRDLAQFGDKVLPTCLIIVPKVTDYHTYGHELRHCFIGQFHK